MYQFHDLGSGAGGGTAALRFEPALFRPIPTLVPPPATPADRTLKQRISEIDLVVDLGQNVGSLEWLRGFVLCAALCYGAYSLGPRLDPMPAAAPAPMADAQYEEARALAISPLAYGADTGRHMAATALVEPLTDTPERPSIDLLATLGRSDGFEHALQRVGVSASDAGEVARLVGQVTPVDGISPGTTASLTLGRRPGKNMRRPLDALTFRARFDLKVEIRRAGAALTLHRIPIAVDNTPLRVQGRVGASLYRSARAAGVPAAVVESYVRALSTKISPASIGSNDRFDIIVEHRRAETGETETGRLLYAGLSRASGKDLQLMQWQQNGALQWFEASGVGRITGMFQRPVPGAITSGFGSRLHPILGYTRMHKGLDFHAARGSPIVAVADGRITRAGWAGGYGQQVMIRHANGLETSYSHMSRMLVRPGQIVRQGQVIGSVGTTGLSTGPHLHFEARRNGAAFNPAGLRYTSQSQLRGGDLASFRAKLRRLLGLRPGGEAAEVKTAAAAPKTDRPRG